MKARVVTLFGLAASVLVIAAVGAAWACVPTSHLWSQPDYAPPGAVVEFHGRGFTAAAGSVELRWGAADGPLLATVPAPDFDTTITVPETADGLYIVYAVSPTADATSSLPSSGTWNRTPFEVSASNTRGSWGDGAWGQQPVAVDPLPARTGQPAAQAAPAAVPAPAAAAPAQEPATTAAPPAASSVRSARPAPAAVATTTPGVPVTASPAAAVPAAPADPVPAPAAEPAPAVAKSPSTPVHPTPVHPAPVRRSDGPQVGLALAGVGIGLLAVTAALAFALPRRADRPAGRAAGVDRHN